uniref:Uncharacterized protein n=1 Tax=Anguilla anguilla TaxID=7936 RepID=A0A0E9V8K4_ANGAN
MGSYIIMLCSRTIITLKLDGPQHW